MRLLYSLIAFLFVASCNSSKESQNKAKESKSLSTSSSVMSVTLKKELQNLPVLYSKITVGGEGTRLSRGFVDKDLSFTYVGKQEILYTELIGLRDHLAAIYKTKGLSERGGGDRGFGEAEGTICVLDQHLTSETLSVRILIAWTKIGNDLYKVYLDVTSTPLDG